MSHDPLMNPMDLVLLNQTSPGYASYCSNGFEAAAVKTCLNRFNGLHTSFDFVNVQALQVFKIMSLVISTITGILILS
jgi:hypothetical protein